VIVPIEIFGMTACFFKIPFLCPMNYFRVFLIAINLFFVMGISQSPLQGQGLYPYPENGLWGYVDDNQVIRISLQFDYAGAFAEGLAPVKRNGKFGFIDKMGNQYIAFQYNNVYPFKNGYARVLGDSLWYYINNVGQLQFEKGFFECKDFFNGLAAVGQDGLFAYIDTSGAQQTPFLYDVADPFLFSKCRVKQGDAYFFIDRHGEKTSQEYDKATPFKYGGVSYVCNNNAWSVIDTNLNVVWKERKLTYKEPLEAIDSACAFGLFVLKSGNKIDLDYCRKPWDSPASILFSDSMIFGADTIHFACEISPLPADEFHVKLMPKEDSIHLGFFIEGMGGRHQTCYDHSGILHTNAFTPAYYQFNIILLEEDTEYDGAWVETKEALKSYKLFPRSPFR